MALGIVFYPSYLAVYQQGVNLAIVTYGVEKMYLTVSTFISYCDIMFSQIVNSRVK